MCLVESIWGEIDVKSTESMTLPSFCSESKIGRIISLLFTTYISTVYNKTNNCAT